LINNARRNAAAKKVIRNKIKEAIPGSVIAKITAKSKFLAIRYAG